MKRISVARILTLIVALTFVCSLGFAADKAADKKDTAKTTKPAAADKKADQKKTAGKTDLIDINTASKADLMSLKDVGEAYSQKIIDGRPYKKKDQLKTKKIIPDAVYDKIKDKIIAKQSK